MQQIDIGSEILDPIFLQKYFLKSKDDAIDVEYETIENADTSVVAALPVPGEEETKE